MKNDMRRLILLFQGSSSSAVLNEPLESVGTSLKRSNSVLVISGGEGYIDFRVGESIFLHIFHIFCAKNQKLRWKKSFFCIYIGVIDDFS